MPRLDFDVVEDGVTSRDNDGLDMPSAEVARKAAAFTATVLSYDRAERGAKPTDVSIVIRDNSGTLDTVTVTLDEAGHVADDRRRNRLAGFGVC